MLFYAVLTIAGVIAAAVLVWMLRSLAVAGKSAYRTISPAARRAQEVKLAHLNTNLAAPPVPWGWGGHHHAPEGAEIGRHSFEQGPTARSKSRDFSQYEAYERSHARSQLQRNPGSPQMGSARNVLTGYDVNRPTHHDAQPDTSSWPYQDSLGEAGASLSKQAEASHEADQPKKPWGW